MQYKIDVKYAIRLLIGIVSLSFAYILFMLRCSGNHNY